MAELKPTDIQEILRIFAESELEELRLDVGGTRLHVTKGGTALPAATTDVSPRRDAMPPAAVPAPPPPAGSSETAQPPAAGSADSATATPASRPGLVDLRSPLLGVFYRRPSPDQPPFVEIGSKVGASDPVCIVDVMKMFTQVPAGVAGSIAEILVEDGQLVEHGQVLMRIDPA